MAEIDVRNFTTNSQIVLLELASQKDFIVAFKASKGMETSYLFLDLITDNA